MSWTIITANQEERPCRPGGGTSVNKCTQWGQVEPLYLGEYTAEEPGELGGTIMEGLRYWPCPFLGELVAVHHQTGDVIIPPV